MRLAIDRLYNNGAITTLLKPRCADITGTVTLEFPFISLGTL